MSLLERFRNFATGSPLRTLISSLIIALLIPITLFANTQSWELRKEAAEEPPQAAPPREFSRFPPGAEFVPGEVLVKFRKEAEPTVQSLQDFDVYYKVVSRETVFKGFGAPSELSRVYKLSFGKDADVLNLVKRLRRDARLEFVEPNYIFRTQIVPNDPYYLDPEPSAPERLLAENRGGWDPTNEDGSPLAYQWGLRRIAQDRAANLFGANEAIVAVVDTGLDYNHPEISGRVWNNPGEIAGNGVDDDQNGYVDDYLGWDAVDYSWQGYQKQADNDPMDDAREPYFDYWDVPNLIGGGHGTHLAGIIAAVSNNGLGIAGMNDQAKIMALRGCDAGGICETDDLAEMIYYAAREGARIINMSWGAYSPSAAIAEALEYAFDRGVVLVAATGNDPLKGVAFPASHPKVIAVAASNERDEVAVYSGWGEEVDVAAPGGDGNWGGTKFRNTRSVLSLRAQGTDMYCLSEPRCWSGEVPQTSMVVGRDENYYRASGTSMAAPHVSGLASLLLSKNPLLVNQQIRQILELSADDILDPGEDDQSGHGRINVERALRDFAETPPPLAMISQPYDQEHLYYGAVEIRGSATGRGFLNFRLDYAPASAPDSWSASGVQLAGDGSRAVENGVLGRWETGSLEGKFFLRLTLNRADGPSLTHQVTVELVNQSLKPSWPKILPFAAALEPVLADLDGDGAEEVVTVVGNQVLAYRGNGQPFNDNFPVLLGTAIRGLAVGEVDTNSPGKEIVVDAVEEAQPETKIVRLDGSLVTAAVGTYFQGVLADVDGNSVDEILNLEKPTKDSPQWRLHALSGTGENVSGFPVRLDDPNNCPTCFIPTAEPDFRVGDIDGDGREDVIFAIAGGGPWNFTRVVAVSGTGEILWQKDLFRGQRRFKTPLVLADLNQDGAQEVIAYNTNWEEEWGEPAEPIRRELYVWRGDGSDFFSAGSLDLRDSGINTGFLYVADVAGESSPEIILTDSGSYPDRLVVISSDGMFEVKDLTGTETRVGGEQVAIGDLDGNGRKDFLVGQETSSANWAVGLLEYVDGQFIEADGWPKSLIAEYGAYGANGEAWHPAVGDLDNNGESELVLQYCLRRKDACFLYVLDTGGSVGDLDWPQYLHDERHTGAYESPGEPTCIPGSLLDGDTNCDCVVNIFDLVRIGVNYGKTVDDPEWDPLADIVADGKINIFDLVSVGVNYSRTCP